MKCYDTWGVYDDCPCGEPPQIDLSKKDQKIYQVVCDSCGNATDWGRLGDVMVQWNGSCRGHNKNKKRRALTND